MTSNPQQFWSFENTHIDKKKKKNQKILQVTYNQSFQNWESRHFCLGHWSQYLVE